MLTMTRIKCAHCREWAFVRNPAEPFCSPCRMEHRKAERRRVELAERDRLNALIASGVKVDTGGRPACVDCGLLVATKNKSGRCKACVCRAMTAERGEEWHQAVIEGRNGIPPFEVNCVECGAVVMTQLKSRKYCSRACYMRNWRFKKWQQERRQKEVSA